VSARVTMSSKSTSYFTFNYSRGDYHGLCDYLLHSDFTPCYSSHNMEHIWEFISDLLLSTMHIFIPVNKILSNQQPIWFNSEIRHCIKQLKTLRRRYKCHPTYHILNKINSLENILQDKMNIAWQNFKCCLINSYTLTNTNKIYRYLKSITKTKSNDMW